MMRCVGAASGTLKQSACMPGVCAGARPPADECLLQSTDHTAVSVHGALLSSLLPVPIDQ